MLHAPTNDRKTKSETSSKTAEHLSEQEQSSHLLRSRQFDSRQQRQNLAAMQNSYGNQAMLRMGRSRSMNPIQGSILQRKCACGNTSGTTGTCTGCQEKQELTLQTKLSISEPGDHYEQEADRIADQVMQMPEPIIKPEVESEKEGFVQRKAISNSITFLQPSSTVQDQSSKMPSIVDEVLRSPGQPLDTETRTFMESRFGHDFGSVRIHTDAKAVESAQAVDSLAYTVRQNIAFGAKKYEPKTANGQRLLAHELVHVIQQGYAPLQQELSPTSMIMPILSPITPLLSSPDLIARNGRDPSVPGTMSVSYVVIYLDDHYIDFHTSRGTFRYYLDYTGLVTGEYAATATVEGNDIHFELLGHLGEFEFSYRLEPNKPNPSTFFAHQPSVTFTITNEEAPEFTPLEDRQELEEDPNVTYLSLEDAMRRCESGDLPGVKVFPYRGTRFGAAPIMAHRDGEYIVVKQPVYVLGNEDFRQQTRTLPTETFIGGVRLHPNEIVRVHTYDPRWYHLNITGSTSDNIENEFCATGEQMLEIAQASTNQTIFNVGLTVVDAALFFVPVGRIAAFLGRPVMQLVGRSSQRLAMAIMLGMRDAAPTAFAGIASRTGTVIVEQQAVSQIGGHAVTQTVGYATVEFSERAITQATTTAATQSVAEVGGEHLATEAIARTMTVTLVDATGHQVVSTLVTPTGDAALDAALDQSFSQTFDLTTTPATSLPAGQGVVSVAPEIAAGFTQAQVQGFRRFIGRRFSESNIQILEQLWDNAARQGDAAMLGAGNSRYLFDLQRNRFWSRVRANAAARAIFEDAGCQFSGGAPYFVLNGQRIYMTIDHIIERQTAPQLALTASNLRISFMRENTVLLRLLHQLDPFQ